MASVAVTPDNKRASRVLTHFVEGAGLRGFHVGSVYALINDGRVVPDAPVGAVLFLVWAGHVGDMTGMILGMTYGHLGMGTVRDVIRIPSLDRRLQAWLQMLPAEAPVLAVDVVIPQDVSDLDLAVQNTKISYIKDMRFVKKALGA